ncbi:hydroxylysine kinase-like [Physella acuta]|uniref:hydroxylysine kinase-like n=1 Tax=Physella acuta TaxID=109671 RepID=UPI0027DDEEFC|nr:hydroxylysine kinase-like [Physella acuta]
MSQDVSAAISVPEEALKPHIADNDVIVRLLNEKYGLQGAELTPLNGYDDLNFHVRVDLDHSNPHIDQVSPNGYFLKIVNLQDSRRPEYLNAQLALMRHIHQKGVKCQTAVLGVLGEAFTQCTAANKKGDAVTYMVSLRSFIPGQVLAKSTLSADLLYRLGQFVAEVSQALQDFDNPFYATFDCLWSLSNIDKVASVTYAVRDDRRRQICEDVLMVYQRDVVPSLPGFRKGYIHGDLNEQNILINKQTEICGLLDFQDAAKSFPLYDLAIHICYMLMTQFSDVTLLDIPGHILAGYQTRLELTPDEGSALRVCVAARMVQSLVYGAYTHYMDPSNTYVLETSKCGWRALETFWVAEPGQLQNRWDSIVAGYK